MRFYSDITKKFYDSIEHCEEAEKVFQKQQEEQEAKKKELAEAKVTRAKEVTEAYQRARTAQKEYEQLRSAFIQEFGHFHLSYSDPDEKSVFSIFEDFFTF